MFDVLAIDASFSQKILHIPIAQCETEIEPNRRLDNIRVKTVSIIGNVIHRPKLAGADQKHTVNVTVPNNYTVRPALSPSRKAIIASRGATASPTSVVGAYLLRTSNSSSLGLGDMPATIKSKNSEISSPVTRLAKCARPWLARHNLRVVTRTGKSSANPRVFRLTLFNIRSLSNLADGAKSTKCFVPSTKRPARRLAGSFRTRRTKPGQPV